MPIFAFHKSWFFKFCQKCLGTKVIWEKQCSISPRRKAEDHFKNGNFLPNSTSIRGRYAEQSFFAKQKLKKTIRQQKQDYWRKKVFSKRHNLGRYLGQEYLLMCTSWITLVFQNFFFRAIYLIMQFFKNYWQKPTDNILWQGVQ